MYHFRGDNSLIPSYRISNLLHSTGAEERFAWMLLREGIQHMREHILLGYTVDFYLPAYRLVVEIDGNQHRRGDHLRRDAKRDIRLIHNGYTVLRLQNKQVRRDGGKAALFARLDSIRTKVYT